MLLKRYKVQIINPNIAAVSNKKYWLITANNLPSVWRKFVRQYFNQLLPNPSDYDISFYDTRSV